MRIAGPTRSYDGDSRPVVERRTVTPEDRERWTRDPVAFVRDELGAKPWQKQVEVIEAVRHHPRVAVRSCNGAGKTYIAAYTVLWWLMCFTDGLVITTAPTGHQVRDILWREIRRAYRGHEDLLGGTLLRTSLELGDKHYAQGLSTDTPERFQGFHEGHILFVVDEASGVREGIYEAIEGSMTSDVARMLLIGNPTSLSGTFYQAFHSKRALWHNIHISAFDTPNLTGGSVVNPALVTPKWVQDAELNWGRESPMYQVRVLGEFPSEAEDTLVPLRLIEAAVKRWKERQTGVRPTPESSPFQGEGMETGPLGFARGDRDGASAQPTPESSPSQGEEVRDGPVEIGVDVARFGSDRTVICVRRGDNVIEVQSFARQDTMATAGRVVDAVRRHSPQAVRVDEIGIGAGVVDRLRELGLPGVTGVNVAQRSSRPEHFANLRAELYDGLKQRFQEGRIAIPDDPELVGQLASVRYSFTSSGQTKTEEKEEVRSRGLPSPDKADALMLAFASMARRPYKIWS